MKSARASVCSSGLPATVSNRSYSACSSIWRPPICVITFTSTSTSLPGSASDDSVRTNASPTAIANDARRLRPITRRAMFCALGASLLAAVSARCTLPAPLLVLPIIIPIVMAFAPPPLDTRRSIALWSSDPPPPSCNSV
eukprot:2669468-Rhodomonas_salina.6